MFSTDNATPRSLVTFMTCDGRLIPVAELPCADAQAYCDRLTDLFEDGTICHSRRLEALLAAGLHPLMAMIAIMEAACSIETICLLAGDVPVAEAGIAKLVEAIAYLRTTGAPYSAIDPLLMAVEAKTDYQPGRGITILSPVTNTYLQGVKPLGE